MPLPASLRRRIADYLHRGTGTRGDNDGRPSTAGAQAQPTPDRDTPRRLVVDMRAVAALLEPYLAATGTRPGSAGVAQVRLMADEIATALGLELSTSFPGEGIVLDIETLGLRAAPVFLVGLMNCPTREIVQLLATDYAAEPALLQAARASLVAAPLVITYNGAAFDLPYLQDRMRYWRLGEAQVGAVLDVLGRLRKKRGEWPNLRLTTVEEACLGRYRVGDIDAAQLPALYSQAVREGTMTPLTVALAHNFMDLWACHDLAALLTDN
ncbi:MAG: ribonuclease H-like domain-containing protein [Armatimonadetes bacterium]|nr:ribonuclease H-like domain-containing protein [Armatimonadota bacterium]